MIEYCILIHDNFQATDVVRKDRLTFDVVTPQRVYHLQVVDGSNYEDWLTKIQEWITYFKRAHNHVVTQLRLDVDPSQRLSSTYTAEDRNKQEDTQRILLASINNYEASTEILEKKISDMKEHITV